MGKLDFAVMSIFAILMVIIGLVFTVQSSKSSKSFFEAGGQTPWWINGLSLFISYFSAATFVVWGSIAYRYGLVANAIQFTMCLSGFVTALFIAGRWKKTGAATAAEYLGRRFGKAAKQYYSYMVLLYSLVSTAAILYAVGKIVYVATPFSLEACITVIGITIIIYTTGGGLWGVLATDVVQFVILSAAVIIIIPLSLSNVGGMTNFLQRAPAHFFDLVNKEYSIGFMVSFFVYQVVYIAGNWSYVQRYTSVSTTRNAKKVAYLFTFLYLVAPIIWMLPPMIYRIINPALKGIEAEGAYMMLCQRVLPAGLIGLVLSGMVAATASKANTTINTAAIIFAQDIYRDVFFKRSTEKRTILVARLFTILFGAGTIFLAILVPAAGGIVEVVLSTAAIAGGSLFGPVIYSLFSRRQTSGSLITISIVSLVVSLFFKVFGPSLLGITLSRTAETVLGVGFPLLLLLLSEGYGWIVRRDVPYLENVPDDTTAVGSGEAAKQNIFGIKVIAWSTAFVGLGIAVLGSIAENGGVALLVGIVIILITAGVLIRQYVKAGKRVVSNKSLYRMIGLVLCFHGICEKGAAQESGERTCYRGDQQISFSWRYGYSEFPFPEASVAAREDARRGKFGWYDGTLWSQAYQCWDSSVIQGVPLLFRGGSPYAREIECTSEIVPYKAAGTPVSFLVPFMYTIGSEEDIAFSLRIKGATEETIVCKLRPQPVVSFTGGLCKVDFITMKVGCAAGVKPIVTVSGMMRIRVYPQLAAYGDRERFVFSSVTHHMDVESSLVVGSLYKNLSGVDPWLLAAKRSLSPDTIAAALQLHDQRLREWRQSTADLSKGLMQKGRVEVFCQGATEKRDRGELRVTAYSGNPVKDFQYGPPSAQMKEMAKAVTGALGRRFSLFRYQHHNLPWKMDNPSELDSAECIYLRNWLEIAGASADTVMLDLQLSPIVKLYRQYTQAGRLPLPATGIPGAEWDKIRQGYLTTIRFARRICPSLKIIQMPYELDNMSGTAAHADAHYQFFKCLYEAVAQFNERLPAADQLKVAGLGSNNPGSRWGFIDGFLLRYSRDSSAKKRLDYITWHGYLFPGGYPAMVEGVGDSLRRLLKLHRLDVGLPVIVDEMGLAEPSTIEDLSDLQGAMKKEAAMASFTDVLQEYYEKEPGNWLPISGAGWHFALLTYGKQNILSAYAKGMLLRSKLGDWKIPVKAMPVDAQGYGLHAVATKEDARISILLSCASPSIFYSEAAPLRYPEIEVLVKDLPAGFRNARLKVTQWYSGYSEEGAVERVLSQDKYQTLPLTRGADRYEKDFSPEEARLLNRIPCRSDIVTAGSTSLSLSVGMEAYGMRLIQIEPDNTK
ncbi:MAG TPA: sodium:solute symporter family protein [Puia sp.]|jgi:SSS family transporter